MIPEQARTALLDLARQAIAKSLGAGATQATAAAAVPDIRAGAFVSLHHHGELRGCIGHLEGDRPLAEVISGCAVSAASSDPRFPPISVSELAGVEIEISVLGPLEVVQRLEDIEVGRHGLFIENGRRRGLLLPQVATEWGWDVQTFLTQTCRKAGLPANAWPEGGATLYRFEAEVFAEKKS